MNIPSIGSQQPGNFQIPDRVSGTSIAPRLPQTAPPQSSNPVTAADKVQQTATKEQVNKAVDSINKTIQATAQNVEFSVDSDSSQLIVKVIDQQTKQVLRQIPTVEILEIAKSLDKLQGLLIKQSA